MIGPYYRPQMTSVLSISHRLTGLFLGVVGVPILFWWLAALASGPDYFARVMGWLGSLPGRLLLLACLFSLCYHGLNGIRHLLWDAGWFLEIRSAYATGWAVIVLSVLLTALIWVGAT